MKGIILITIFQIHILSNAIEFEIESKNKTLFKFLKNNSNLSFEELNDNEISSLFEENSSFKINFESKEYSNLQFVIDLQSSESKLPCSVLSGTSSNDLTVNHSDSNNTIIESELKHKNNKIRMVLKNEKCKGKKLKNQGILGLSKRQNLTTIKSQDSTVPQLSNFLWNFENVTSFILNLNEEFKSLTINFNNTEKNDIIWLKSNDNNKSYNYWNSNMTGISFIYNDSFIISNNSIKEGTVIFNPSINHLEFDETHIEYFLKIFGPKCISIPCNPKDYTIICTKDVKIEDFPTFSIEMGNQLFKIKTENLFWKRGIIYILKILFKKNAEFNLIGSPFLEQFNTHYSLKTNQVGFSLNENIFGKKNPLQKNDYSFEIILAVTIFTFIIFLIVVLIILRKSKPEVTITEIKDHNDLYNQLTRDTQRL